MARIAGMATPVCIDKYYGWDIIIYATVPIVLQCVAECRKEVSSDHQASFGARLSQKYTKFKSHAKPIVWTENDKTTTRLELY